ncbi:DEDD exonuclease domain-containing protein [Jatrophihabitans fulvus]
MTAARPLTPTGAPPPAPSRLRPVPAAQQLSFDELGEPLRDTTFVVVDLETTGGAANSDGITEIGAVKVRGGQVLGEFQTLVNPQRSIPAFVSVLTGITDSMVVQAPTIDSAVPSFLEFARGAVLVAHNAPFDIGFLKAACAELATPWPSHAVVDTAVLARRVLTRDEVPNCKLGTLAPFFRATTTPTHRALDDARATVDVLHGLLERLGPLGVHSLTELRSFTAQVSEAQRRKRHLADGMPTGPGVYIFRDAQGRPLYVGTSRNLRTRVRQYFVASETRSRIGEMIGIAERVDPIPCAHALEAQVRELRLIAAHKPRYNKRSKFPERSVWLKLTVEPFPRLSVVRQVRADGAPYLGPLRTQRQAEVVRDAIHDAVPLRQCTDKLSLRRVVRAACLLAGIGKCSAPCEGGTSPEQYDALVGLVAQAWTGDVRPLVAPLEAKLAALAGQQRYEQAGTVRDRIMTVVRAAARMQRLSSLRAVTELVAARPDGDGGWELSVVRSGRLVAAGVATRGIAPWPVIDALRATADVVDPARSPSEGPLAEETECILSWLEQPGTRLVDTSQPWVMPAYGAGSLTTYLAGGAGSGRTDPFADRRRLPMTAQPARAAR